MSIAQLEFKDKAAGDTDLGADILVTIDGEATQTIRLVNAQLASNAKRLEAAGKTGALFSRAAQMSAET